MFHLQRPPSLAAARGGAVGKHPHRPLFAAVPPRSRRPATVVALASTNKKKPARPVQPGSNYPAGEFCSNCGLCDTEYIAHVRDSCAFLGEGMARIEKMEATVHGRGRVTAGPEASLKAAIEDNEKTSSGTTTPSSASSTPPVPRGYDELRFGVTRRVLYGQRQPGFPGAQWTGVVTSIACAMLEQGMVDAVVVTQPEKLAEDEEEDGQEDDGYDGPGANNAKNAKKQKDPFAPVPVVARTVQDIVRARGVRPTLSPTLAALSAVEALAGGPQPVRRLLFVGVGCQVQALRAIEPYLGLEKLYVLGTNCVDNGRREGLGKFLRAAEKALAAADDDGKKDADAAKNAANEGRPPSGKGPIRHYEFMQNLNVMFMRSPASSAASAGAKTSPRPPPPPPPPELLPYFCLPADELNDVIAPSCYSCFDYANALADLTVGYMGVPYKGGNTPMTAHPQYLTVRNEKGEEMLSALPWGDGGKSGGEAASALSSSSSSSGPTVGNAVFVSTPPESRGDRRPWVMSTLLSDDAAKLGEGPEMPAPLFVGRFLAWLLSFFTPKGLEFAAYSVDYHTLRNWIYVQRHMGKGGGGEKGGGGGGGGGGSAGSSSRADAHVPSFAKAIVAEYEASSGGKVSARIPLRPKAEAYKRPGFVWGPGGPVPKAKEVEVRASAGAE
jgi:7-hydroxymethyl chlorophyll a reductase